MTEGDIEAPAPPPGPPGGGGGGGGAAHEAPTRVDVPSDYSFLTTRAITDMCTGFEEESKGQSNRELLADFVTLFESAPALTLGEEIGGFIKRGNASDEEVTRALQVIVQGMILEKKLEGTRQEERMEALMDSNKFSGIVMCMPMDHSVVRSWLNARWHAQEQIEEDRRTSSKTPSMVFSSQNLPEVPSDGKDHEPKVRLLQYKVLQAIRALPDTPAKNITSIRKALSKSTKLSYKAMTIRETLALTYPTTVIDAMGEFQMFDCFLEKCQEGLNLAEMLDEQISVCKRELIQDKGESAADFAARAENAMSLFEELLRGSGFTNDQDGVDKYSTDRKRSQVIIAGLRPVYFGMITQIFSGKNDKDRYSMVIGTADKPTLAASLLETDSLVKTQNLGDPEWGEQSHKGKEDKNKGKDSAKQHWDKVTKAEVKNLKAIDSGEKKHPCAGDVQFTKHDWAPGTGAIGRFDPRGTQFRPCAWELNDGVCNREGCKSSHGDEMAETIAGYPAGWHAWRRTVQTPSHSFKAASQVKATDAPMWNSSELRDEVVESKVELKAAVESMKSDLMKEFATILKTQAEEHSKALAQVQVTKAETRTAGARRAAGVYSGRGTDTAVTALTTEPPELGEEGVFEIFKFKEVSKEVSSMKKRSTQTPPIRIQEEFTLEKFEEDPLTLAWVDALVGGNVEKHDQIDAAYLRDTVAGGTLDNVNVGMNAVLCFLKNGLIDEPQQHTLTVLSTLLGIDYENGYDRADQIAMMNDVGERLHRQGYVWTRAEAVAHFGDFQVGRLRQVAEHLKVLWHILNTEDSGEFKIRPLHCRYTYEYHSRFGGYVYDHDGRLAKQDKTDKRVTIGHQVRERNRKTPEFDQVEGKGEEKCGESEPIFTNHEGDVPIMALAGRRSSSRHEGKLLVPGHKPKRRKESDFHQAAVRNSGGKSGPNPVGFSKWGQTLPAGSNSGYSTLTVLEGSATKRTQMRDVGAHSLFVKRGEPNPNDVQAANLNRLAMHKAKVEARMIKKHPRKRGILKLPLYEQREVFRDMSRRRRDRYAASKPMIEALSEPTKVFEPKHATSWGAYSAAGKHDVCTIMGVDPLKSKKDEAANAPDSSTLVPWVETLVSSAVGLCIA